MRDIPYVEVNTVGYTSMGGVGTFKMGMMTTKIKRPEKVRNDDVTRQLTRKGCYRRAHSSLSVT